MKNVLLLLTLILAVANPPVMARAIDVYALSQGGQSALAMDTNAATTKHPDRAGPNNIIQNRGQTVKFAQSKRQVKTDRMEQILADPFQGDSDKLQPTGLVNTLLGLGLLSIGMLLKHKPKGWKPQAPRKCLERAQGGANAWVKNVLRHAGNNK